MNPPEYDKSRPAFINMIMAESSLWFPHAYQMVIWPNPSRLNALWLGLVAPLVMMPMRLMVEVILMALMGNIRMAGRNLVFVPISTVLWAFEGCKGNLFAIDLPYKDMVRARFLSVPECFLALRDGKDALLIDDGWAPVPAHTAAVHDQQGSAPAP